ncbi:MAG: DUF1540 domain-containing protein [Clostridia bacterium]|nr:DUF1540 domain-containing protein [Clostridia bacterium]
MEEKNYETPCGNYSCNCLKGIVCNAQNCTYNDGECHCHATQISVGPKCADCSGETSCATFKPKTY